MSGSLKCKMSFFFFFLFVAQRRKISDCVKFVQVTCVLILQKFGGIRGVRIKRMAPLRLASSSPQTQT